MCDDVVIVNSRASSYRYNVHYYMILYKEYLYKCKQ